MGGGECVKDSSFFLLFFGQRTRAHWQRQLPEAKRLPPRTWAVAAPPPPRGITADTRPTPPGLWQRPGRPRRRRWGATTTRPRRRRRCRGQRRRRRRPAWRGGARSLKKIRYSEAELAAGVAAVAPPQPPPPPPPPEDRAAALRAIIAEVPRDRAGVHSFAIDW